MRAKQPLPLRGGQSVLQPGSHSCYKAIYFNVERATFVIAGVLQMHLNMHAPWKAAHGSMVLVEEDALRLLKLAGKPWPSLSSHAQR